MNLLTFQQLMDNVGNRSEQFSELYLTGMADADSLADELANIIRNQNRKTPFLKRDQTSVQNLTH